MDCFIYFFKAKTKIQINCVVKTRLICAFASEYAKSMFSHDCLILRLLTLIKFMKMSNFTVCFCMSETGIISVLGYLYACILTLNMYRIFFKAIFKLYLSGPYEACHRKNLFL